MNLTVLNQKLALLESYRGISRDAVRKLGKILPDLGEWNLLRMNPLEFASSHGFDVGSTIDLFVHATRVGIFDLSWNLLCPSCGLLVDSHASINDLRDGVFHCTLCRVDVPGDLDDQVEVSFAINPALQELNIDAYSDFSSYWHYFMSGNFRRSQALTDYVNEMRRGQLLIGPDRAGKIEFEAQPSRLYRLMSPENHTACYIKTTAAGESEQTLHVEMLEGGFSPAELSIPSGKVFLTINNSLGRSAGVVLVETDFDRLERIVRESPSRMLPFFTGKMLLNNQSFRNLFRVQHLVPDLKLRIRSLTILFTDLKGSTDLYDRTGDAFAYSLVQEHYRLLSEAVRANAGAVIKTMGDAIMASFSDSHSATRAAILMMSGIDSLNTDLNPKGHSLGLKIGMHEGPALAVNADDRLDYFGQTVNIAARVQALCSEGEIWLTEPVEKATGVRETLQSAAYRDVRHRVSLKGVGQPATVYQFKR